MHGIRWIIDALAAILLLAPFISLVEAQGWSPYAYYKSPWGLTTLNITAPNPAADRSGYYEVMDYRYENCYRAPATNADGSPGPGQAPLEYYVGLFSFYNAPGYSNVFLNRIKCIEKCWNVTRPDGDTSGPRYYGWIYAGMGFVPPQYNNFRCYCGNRTLTPVR